MFWMYSILVFRLKWRHANYALISKPLLKVNFSYLSYSSFLVKQGYWRVDRTIYNLYTSKCNWVSFWRFLGYLLCLTFWPGQKCHSRWFTGRKWHILMAVMRGNRVGGNWLMKWDEVKKIPLYSHRLKHRKRVTSELHDRYFRSMTSHRPFQR